jgi:phytoene dehydrogenase-like protein
MDASDHDAIVVGAGPNGLVAANILADAGWSVLVLEEQPAWGGAVRSGELTVPGFEHDMFSAFYPFAACSPPIASLNLHEWGLQWRHAPLVIAHPRPDGSCACLSRDLEETVDGLERLHPGDGRAWRRLYSIWEEARPHLMEAVLGPFPPVRPAARLATAMGRDLMRLARLGVTPMRRLAEEEFYGWGGPMLLAGNALHADLTPEAALSGMFGWLLTSLGQDAGFPVAAGGSSRLADAMVTRLKDRGGRILCNRRVAEVSIRRNRAVGCVTDDGDAFAARKAVLADVGAPSLYLDLVGPEHLPLDFVRDIDRFQYDNATFKVDWALAKPIPWECEPARRAGTIHVARDLDFLSEVTAMVGRGMVPERPYLVLGQMNLADPSRSPAGTETAWAYTHLPQVVRGDMKGEITGAWDEREVEAFVGRIEAQVERLAPGFRDAIIRRHVFTPAKFQESNSNLVNGALNGGTSQLHQQAIFRPVPNLARPETPVRGLYLASASAHPGGGVHGAPGSNAALAALRNERRKRAAAAGALLAGLGAAASRAGRRR